MDTENELVAVMQTFAGDEEKMPFIYVPYMVRADFNDLNRQ